jgi:SAM-dependent methyltransferase
MPKRVLDIGAGPADNSHGTVRHAVFNGWEAIRLDIDPTVKPDILGSVANLSKLSPQGAFDGIWSSHVFEHLDDHLVQPSLDACYRVLKRDGFAIVTCPDLLQVARLIVDGDPDRVVYNSPAGPITPLDILFGHRASVARGNAYMAHRTGFTPQRLAQRLVEAGFREVWTAQGRFYDLWAVALMPTASPAYVRQQLAGSGLRFMTPEATA